MTFFYNLNKTLDSIREKPETTHGQLNERAMSKQRPQEVDEGFMDAAKTAAQQALNVLGHGDDQAMIRDLQKKAGLPQTGKVPPQQPGQQNTTTAGQQPMAEEGGIPMTPKQKSFAAIAEPTDKITFADKIAGAKKEVDEMLGDVAAEAMKSALSGGQKKLDRNKDGKISGQDFAMMRKGRKQVADEGFPTVAGARDEMRKRKVGDVTHGAKHDTEETPTGRRVTRRLDPNTGYSVGSDTDDEGNAKSTEKRGRGRPKKADRAPERVTAKAYKHKGGRKNEAVEEGVGEGEDLVKLSKVIASCKTHEQLLAAQKMANNFLKKHRAGGFSNMAKDMGRRSDVDDTLQQKNRELQGGQELEEKAVSKKQQKFMGMVHATQKGEKAPSKEVGKVAKTMKKSDAKDFASTKQKGLPEKAPKKKEKTEETTVAGSVAPTAGGKAKGGSIVGKGIYDSLNRDLEAMISESMNVSVNMSMDEHGEPRKSITISADGDAAEQLAQLLNLAGMQAQAGEESCGTCGESACHCDEEMVDENSPDWPTDQETIGNDDPLMRRYAGGVNGPKSTGQTTGSPYNRQDARQGVMGESAVSDIGMKLYAELKSFKG